MMALVLLLCTAAAPAAQAQSPYAPNYCSDAINLEATFEYDYVYSWREDWQTFSVDFYAEVGCWPEWLW